MYVIKKSILLDQKAMKKPQGLQKKKDKAFQSFFKQDG
jgi:hypothetical protein